jgi:hypothetical protein
MDKPSCSCSYSADRDDWVDWGGHYKEWSTILDKLGVDGNEWDCPHDAVATVDSVSLCASHISPYFRMR